MTWTWWGVPGTLMLVASWIAAVLVFRTAPARAINQRLALLLIVTGIYIGFSAGPLFFLRDREAVRAMAITGTALYAALPWLYLAFLGASLDTRLVRPFRSNRAFAVLTALGIVSGAIVFALPHRFVSALYHPGWAPWNFQRSELGLLLNNIDGLVGAFGLVAAIVTYRRTLPESAARQRAKWFAIAFGIRDVYAAIPSVLYPILRPLPFWGDFLFNPGLAFCYLLFLLGLAYGVLSTQLLDIKVKVRFALEQSTIGAAIAGAFFVISELIEAISPLHGAVESLIVAMVVVVALRPVQRFANRFAERMMRGVSDSPGYHEKRRLEVYRAALEGAMDDGLITDKEAAILERLRVELGLSDDEVTVAEARVLEMVAAR